MTYKEATRLIQMDMAGVVAEHLVRINPSLGNVPSIRDVLWFYDAQKTASKYQDAVLIHPKKYFHWVEHMRAICQDYLI